MRRGELARRSGCNAETVRFYEQQGLLPSPPRTGGGHRAYGAEHLRRLTFIRRSRELGFTLDQVRGLLALVDGGALSCSEVRALTLDHALEIRRKIADLERMAFVLEDIAARCVGDEAPDCPVIDALFRERPLAGEELKAGRDGRCPEA